MGKIAFRNVDIYQYPQQTQIDFVKQFVAEAGEKLLHADGDSHANPFRLLWNWVVAGAIEVPESSYQELVKLYKVIRGESEWRRQSSLLAPMSQAACDSILKFIEIIHTKIKVKPNCQMVLLQLGDTENDRNGPDTLIKALFYHLQANGMPVNECWSNHNHDGFLLDNGKASFGYEQEGHKQLNEYISYREHDKFLDAMQYFYPEVEAEEIFENCTEENYKRYQLIYYTKDDKGCLNLAYHAPVPPKMLKIILAMWYLNEGDKTVGKPCDFKELINWANEQFRKKIFMIENPFLSENALEGYALHQINSKTPRMFQLFDGNCTRLLPHPIYFLTWFRLKEIEEYNFLLKDYDAVNAQFPGEMRLWAHGHDGRVDEKGPNLNSNVGILWGLQANDILPMMQTELKPGCHNLNVATTFPKTENQLDRLCKQVAQSRANPAVHENSSANTMNSVHFADPTSIKVGQKRPASSAVDDLPSKRPILGV